MAGHQDNDDTPKSGLLSHADITSRLMDLESQETDMTTEWKTVLALRAVEDVKMKKKRDQEDAIWKQRFDQMDRDEDVSVSCIRCFWHFHRSYINRIVYLTD